MDDSENICPASFLKLANGKDTVLDTLRKYLTPDQSDKEMFGEVFTPLELVCDMLSKLPKSVWKNKDLKWLDPANGIGNFPVIVYYKLMSTLESVMPDKEERSIHIIENMLFMVELNPINVALCKKVFKMLDDKATPNIYRGDFLEGREDMHKLNEKDKQKKSLPIEFDIIIGNPPYNKGGVKSGNGKHAGQDSKTIWPNFIDASFSLLVEKGWLIFITPLSWLKKSHPKHIPLLEKYIVWLQLWDNSRSKDSINADIPLSMYVLQNTINVKKQPTVIISDMKRAHIKSKSFEYLNPSESIPLAYHSIFEKLHSYITKNKLQLEIQTKTMKETGPEFLLPDGYKKEKKGTFSVKTYRIKDGFIVQKSTQNHPDALSNKLIFANMSSFNGAFIDKGYLGLSSNKLFYILGDRLEWLLKLFSFPITSIIASFTKYNQDFLDREAFSFIPDIRKLGHEVSEDELYELIGLTKDEIKQIQSFSKKEQVPEEHDENEGKRKRKSHIKKSEKNRKSKRKHKRTDSTRSKQELKSRETFRRSMRKK
jgi:hypothetical protein